MVSLYGQPSIHRRLDLSVRSDIATSFARRINEEEESGSRYPYFTSVLGKIIYLPPGRLSTQADVTCHIQWPMAICILPHGSFDDITPPMEKYL